MHVLDTIQRDLRFALRALARQPGFAIVVILTLALGIGAATAIFTVVHAVIFQPLPFREPDRLVHIYESYPKGGRYRWGSEQSFISVRPGSYHDWAEQSASFESIGGYYWKTVLLTGSGTAEVAQGHEVTPGFFEVLGTRPQLGRTFTAADYDSRSVILSYELWQRRHGGDPGIIGRTISLDNAGYIVAGVMPRGFYPTRLDPPQFWLPLVFTPEMKHSRVRWGMTIVARLKPGVTLDRSQLEMDVIADRLTTAYPEHYDNMCAVVIPVTGYLYSQYERMFYMLLGAVALVLLIACANVANLLLARATQREREFALRAALGAARGRLIVQLMTESALLAGLAGIVGVVLARLGIGPILSLLPAISRVPRLAAVDLNLPVLAFACVAAIATGVLFGLAPALRFSRPDPNEALKEGGRGNSAGSRTRRLSDVLVVAEVALALVLLVSAGLLVRTFYGLLKTDPGFRPDHVLAVSVTVPTHHYGEYVTGGANPSRARLFAELERQIAQIPSVTAATATALLPLRHGPNPWAMHVVGRPAPPLNQSEYGGAARTNRTGLYNHGSISVERVSPGYFATFGIPLVRGRLFTGQDIAGKPMVALVNQTLATKYFPGEDPVGKSVIVDMTSYFPRMTIVGVVADSKMNAMDRDPYPTVFWVLDQMPSSNTWIAVRARMEPEGAAAAVQETVRKLDRDLAITEVKAMPTVMGESLWRPRFAAALLTVFAALATLLTAAGVYAVFWYLISRRTQEMGVRVALGAGRWQIVTLVMWPALRLTLIGVMIGGVASFALGRAWGSHLFGARSGDPLLTMGLAAGITGVAMLACLRPALHATRIDPLVALRME
jgi:putative ABC transport system permease protein